MASPATLPNGTTTPPADQKPAVPQEQLPQTSASDDGTARRPRDARLIHLILSNLGIHSYQERVPLALLDFSYRYTSSVLSDALRLSSEGYASTTTSNRRDAAKDGSEITVNALRQAIASRQDYQFQGPLPKEFMLEQANERNRTVLPKVEKTWGVQLPDERYCLTGNAWRVEDWEDAEGDTDKALEDGMGKRSVPNGEVEVDGAEGNAKEEAEAEDEDMGGFEDVFGSGAGEDREMGDA